MTDYGAATLFFEQDAVMNIMREDEAAVASQIYIDHLDIRLTPGQVILSGQCAANFAISDIVMDRLDAQRWLGAVVGDMEQAKAPDHRRAQMLQNETLIAIIRPSVTQHAKAVSRAGYVGEPLPILLGRFLTDALDIAHHREAECIGVQAAEPRVVEIRLKHDARVRVEKFEHRSFGDQAFVM